MASKRRLDAYLEQLTSPIYEIRREAALNLGKISSKKSLVPLCTALSDSHWSVRRNAARALGKIGDADAVDPLCQLLIRETYPSVRKKIILALGKLGDSRAATAICSLFERESALRTRKLTQYLLSEPVRPVLLICHALCLSTEEVPPLAAPVLKQTLIQYPSQLLHILLEDPRLTGRQRWVNLDALRGAGKSWLRPAFVPDVRRYCETVLEHPDAALRTGAQQVLDYMSLGRASQRDLTGDPALLLRIPSEQTVAVSGETLLRASQNHATEDPDDTDPERPLLSRLWSNLRRLTQPFAPRETRRIDDA